MTDAQNIADRLRTLVGCQNRDIETMALTKGLLGLALSVLTFGFIFVVCRSLGVLVAQLLGMDALLFAWLVTGVFLLLSVWSAWHRVDPTSGLKRLTNQQLLLTYLSQASSNLVYFSPRHATAGIAVIMISGPANVFQALGHWLHRIRVNDEAIHEAAQLLLACNKEVPIENVQDESAAVLLRRLALIKVVNPDHEPALTVTDKGLTLLAGKRRKDISSDASTKRR